jgi:hypothetical protein
MYHHCHLLAFSGTTSSFLKPQMDRKWRDIMRQNCTPVAINMYHHCHLLAFSETTNSFLWL